MTKDELIGELESRFLTKCRGECGRLSEIFTDYKFNTWSNEVGSLTLLQGHDVGVECLFPDASANQANCVAIIVGLKHLTTEPMLCEASVTWGAGISPDISADLIDDPIPATSENFDMIEEQFPQLVRELENAIRAWTPDVT